MKMKTSLYLDTSIPSAFFDTSKSIRQIITQKWFENDVADFHIVTSVVTIDEINGFHNETKKLNILELIAEFNVEILDVNDAIRNLANLYIKTWNFKHIISVNPIRKIHEINKMIGYQEILIGSPELFGGYKYGNI